MSSHYVGRFAPSPSGPLHAGSLVAALASYVDARAANGTWLIRIEDLDTPRVVKGSDQMIIEQLAQLGMHSDRPILYQSHRLTAYQEAFDRLMAIDAVFACGCTRQEIADSQTRALTPGLSHPSSHLFTEHPRPYPGTCRQSMPEDKRGRAKHAYRFKVSPTHSDVVITFEDRWCGLQTQNVTQAVGDFVIQRADGIWSYQLAVVVDDDFQGITHIVRGQDLLDSTARQQHLAQTLRLTAPKTLHVPVLYDSRGLKYSKQNHAPALELSKPVECLNAAWVALGFNPLDVPDVQGFWSEAVLRWKDRFFMR